MERPKTYIIKLSDDERTELQKKFGIAPFLVFQNMNFNTQQHK